ncbi:FtsK/SpoIIIE domain-containing protein [Metasolibacillus meyeri]|uniref:FtsK/SpoIIIE domain-containing protein n=1 Tax=Metasolibacillus meyeri TaxID=1071052 RepID=A0AAW9NWL5_9BACL|nr:FtsK/SpoIIIE domain-containing protein [Metasolibacillus meyeri]MEC1179050.1 FtsK/SpoIIIE domain-containing protein [Metasolibacillus meyeri]
MKKHKNNFKKVSYFSKTPVFPRFSFLLITIVFLIGLAAFTINYFSHSNVLQFFCSLSILIMSIYFIKSWILIRKEYNSSPLKKLKRFIKENKLYEEDIREVGTNENGSIKRRKIVVNSIYFLYKKTENNELIIRALKRADRFSDKANSYETLLSALFGLPLYKKIDEITYCDYIFELVPDERIILSHNPLKKTDTTIRVTHKIFYDISKVSHGLLVGSTGSGKSFYVNSKILDYARMGAELYIVDPKSADLSLIRFIEGFGEKRVASKPNQIARILREVNEIMENRYQKHFREVSAFGKTFLDFSLPPVVIVIDEWAAFIQGVDKKLHDECSRYLLQLILKGRASGCFVELILQRPDTSFIEGAVRDSIGCRIALGNMSKQGYEMCFGSTDIDYKTITVKVGGYIQIDGQHNSPVYFETPLIQNNFNFLEELQSIISHPLRNPESNRNREADAQASERSVRVFSIN